MKEDLDSLRQARRSLERVRRRLLSPTIAALDSSASDLAAAIECLEQMERDIRSGQRRGPGWRQAMQAEIGGLRRELHEVNALLAAAGKFFEGWARLAAAGAEGDASNYTAQGTPGEVVCIRSNRMVVHG